MQVRWNVCLLPGIMLFAATVLSGPLQADEIITASARSSPAPTFERPPAVGWRNLVTGRLANGVRFAILPRHDTEPGVGVLMRNEGGFIAERRPGERGLAHLIEHVVFQSPTLGSPDEARHFQRIGLQLTFPAPHVATTSWRESNYFLSSKTKKADDIDRILGLLREAATDLTFRADTVDAERASVLREMADKKLGNDIYASYIAAVAPGSPTDVIDAQNSDDVPTASVETIRSLYRRLYQPRDMMIVIVGDVDAAQMKALIGKRFGNWRSTGAVSGRAPYPQFQRGRIKPISFSMLSQGRRTALMTVVKPLPAPPGSRVRQVRDEIMELVVMRAITDRLAASQPDSPPGKTGIYIEHGEQGHRLIMLWDNFASNQWKPAVVNLRKATCALATAGFTEKEWPAAGQNVIADLEHRARDMATVPNVKLAIDVSHALADGRKPIPPNETLRYARILVPRMDARQGSAWWHREWHGGTEQLRVEAPELADVADPLSTIRGVANADGRGSSCAIG